MVVLQRADQISPRAIHLQRRARQNQRGRGASGKGRYRERKRATREECVGLWHLKKFFLSFMGCSRRGFLGVLGSVSYERHGIMFVLSLRRLRRVLLAYLRFKFFSRVLTRFAVLFFA